MKTIVLLLSYISLCAGAAETTLAVESTPIKTKTLIESISDSLNDQTLSQHAYYLTAGINVIDSEISSEPGNAIDQPTLHLGIRLWKNLWLEAGYGTSVINDYPSIGLDTKIKRTSGKLRYNIEVTSYFHIQPFAGYYGTQVDSPGSGVQDGDYNLSSYELQKEMEDVQSLRTEGLAYGGSLIFKYKRLALKADIGNDSLGLGLGAFF